MDAEITKATSKEAHISAQLRFKQFKLCHYNSKLNLKLNGFLESPKGQLKALERAWASAARCLNHNVTCSSSSSKRN